MNDMLDDMGLGIVSWPFFQILPSLDHNQVGQPLSQERFQEDWDSDYAQFFKTFRTIHDGEVLELEGAWVDIESQKDWQQAWIWHVQYATNQAQRDRMQQRLCPGTRLDPASTRRVLHGTARLPIEVCQSIGMDTTVHRSNGQLGTHELRTATVLTWPQLFIMGAHAKLTALEVYTVGLMCQLIMAPRVKSKGGGESRDKFRAKNPKPRPRPKARPKGSAATIGANQTTNGIDQATTPGDSWQTSGWQDAAAQRWWQTTSTAHQVGTWVDWPNATQDGTGDTKAWHGWCS